jgi:hypothetical protein
MYYYSMKIINYLSEKKFIIFPVREKDLILQKLSIKIILSPKFFKNILFIIKEKITGMQVPGPFVT